MPLTMYPNMAAIAALCSMSDETFNALDHYTKVTDIDRDYPTQYVFRDWSMYNKKGNQYYYREVNYYCMRHFSQNHFHPTDGLAFRVTNRTGRPKTVKKFYEYLFSPDGPWRDALPGLSLLNTDTSSTSSDVPTHIIWHNTGISPVKITMNLLCAVRLHTCWGLDIIWERLVDNGFTPEEAILLCTNFNWDEQEITVDNGSPAKHSENPEKKLDLYLSGASMTDMPFTTNANPSGFCRLIKDKTPLNVLGSLAAGTPPQPNNYLWHDDGEEINADDAEDWCGKIKTICDDDYRCMNQESDYDLVNLLTNKKSTFNPKMLEEIRNALLNNIEITL